MQYQTCSQSYRDADTRCPIPAPCSLPEDACLRSKDRKLRAWKGKHLGDDVDYGVERLVSKCLPPVPLQRPLLAAAGQAFASIDTHTCWLHSSPVLHPTQLAMEEGEDSKDVAVAC